ncbi:hypothetical protein WJ74_33830 [Burkholderia ubonensis]|nr:hypothetical protein WJ74_33830 [Burkholderia ubonensis]
MLADFGIGYRRTIGLDDRTVDVILVHGVEEVPLDRLLTNRRPTRLLQFATHGSHRPWIDALSQIVPHGVGLECLRKLRAIRKLPQGLAIRCARRIEQDGLHRVLVCRTSDVHIGHLLAPDLQPVHFDLVTIDLGAPIGIRVLKYHFCPIWPA